MRYRMFYNNRGERIWLPILAGAAIISAPFWLNNQKCCNNQGYYPQPYPVMPPPYQQYQYNYNYPVYSQPPYYQPPVQYQQPYPY